MSPSIAHLLAQYGATSGEVDLPQPDEMLMMMPELFSNMIGMVWRIILAVPLMLMDVRLSKSLAGISQRREE